MSTSQRKSSVPSLYDPLCDHGRLLLCFIVPPFVYVVMAACVQFPGCRLYPRCHALSYLNDACRESIHSPPDHACRRSDDSSPRQSQTPLARNINDRTQVPGRLSWRSVSKNGGSLPHRGSVSVTSSKQDVADTHLLDRTVAVPLRRWFKRSIQHRGCTQSCGP